MATHRRRNGQRIVCYWCKNNNHAFCSNDDPELVEVIVCHCPQCNPDCGNPDCYKARHLTRRKSGTVTKWKHDDPRWER